MTISTTLMIAFLGIVFILFIGLTCFLVILGYDRIIVRNRNPVFDEGFEQLLLILAVIINSEIEEYESEILAGDKPITNQQFESFYEDICNKIYANISQDLIDALCRYTTHDNVIRIIVRRTKGYLRDKIRNAS